MTSIRLRTPIPGPESRRLMERRDRSVPRAVYHMSPVFIEHGEGAIVQDVDGNVFLDFAGGLGCLNVGHKAPAVVAAVRKQLDRFLHTCFHVMPYSAYVRLAEELNARAPGDFEKKTLFLNSGAEAVENAVKIARAFTGRSAIVCFEDGFHGRTLLAMSLTSKTHPYKGGFGPFAPEIYRVPYGYCYRCAYSRRYPECQAYCAHRVEDVFSRYVAAESVAAMIVEPVLGEGGFVCPPQEFFTVLAEICRRHGILLIVDEVQTGYGRTGALFACEQFGLVPDLLVTGKSIASGLPLASVTGRKQIMDAPVVGALGGTFGGNPLACEAALAVLEIFERENLAERARRIGSLFEKLTSDWKARFPLVGDIRGLGAMRALELVRDPQTREPAREETEAVIRSCYESGLIVLSAGTYGNVIRLLVPLVATDEQIQEGLAVIKSALAAVTERTLAREA